MPFKPGVSGNPGGKPKLNAGFKTLTSVQTQQLSDQQQVTMNQDTPVYFAVFPPMNDTAVQTNDAKEDK